MSKKICACVCCVLIAVLLSAASVWEGAAGIASVEEFPVAGHYVKSNAFPRNTIVEITNLENGVVVNAIVTDSASSAGVLAVLAPSTADSLGIVEGGITRIRVRIPDGLFDASEFAVNTGMMDPDVNPAAAVAMDRARYESTAVPSDSVTEITQPEPAVIAAAPAEISVPSVVDTTGIADLVPLEEPVDVPADVPAESDAESVDVYAVAPEPTDAVALIESDEVGVVPDAVDNGEENPEVVEDVAAVPESDVVIPAEPEVVAVAPVVPVEEVVDEVPVSDDFAVLPDEADVASVAEPAAVEVPAVETERAAEEVAVTDEYDAAATAENVSITDEPVVAERPAVVDDGMAAAVSEVVSLEPAEPLPPVVSAVDVPVADDVLPVPAADDEPDLVIAPEPVIESPVVVEPPAAEPAAVAVVPETNDTDLPFVEELDHSAYYIQIAVMSHTDAVRDLVSKYAEYPLVVKKTEKNGKTLYRVMVGPISLDEYGATLERFRKLGFTDAFVASVSR